MKTAGMPLMGYAVPAVQHAENPLRDFKGAEPLNPFCATVVTTGPTPQGGIGDITSDRPGTAARYNAGKAPLELIPLRCIVQVYDTTVEMPAERGNALEALNSLAKWQETGAEEHLINALRDLDDCWADCAAVFDYGRKKYAAWNWAKGFNWSVPLACAARHLKSILDGEETDPESGHPHRGHVYCNIVMLLTFLRTYPEGDDRPRLLAPKAAA